MVLFVLYVKADLENVETLTAPALHRCWRPWRGAFHAQVAGRQQTLAAHGSARRQEAHARNSAADSGEFVPFVGFECRGLEPYAWHPESGYRVISAGRHAAFDDVDLSDDWADYDEEGEQSVGVYSVEWKFEVHK
ncbi:hypothetical protein KRP22_015113 [Phytophthora ramorum]|nr:hypothetical protein KRP22_15046 [Phytophthora ramorum]